jgi:hypothetical protein
MKTKHWFTRTSQTSVTREPSNPRALCGDLPVRGTSVTTAKLKQSLARSANMQTLRSMHQPRRARARHNARASHSD